MGIHLISNMHLSTHPTPSDLCCCSFEGDCSVVVVVVVVVESVFIVAYIICGGVVSGPCLIMFSIFSTISLDKCLFQNTCRFP